MNKAILVGRVGTDPELRHTQSGTAVVNFSLATKEKYKDREGKPQELTEWHRICVFGKLAEICMQYLRTGNLVGVEGKIVTESWEEKGGTKKWVTKIEVGMKGDIKFLSRSNDNSPKVDNGQEYKSNQKDQVKQDPELLKKGQEVFNVPVNPFEPEELPF